EGRGRTQACESRQLGRMLDLNILIDAGPAQALSERGVLDLFTIANAFDFAIGDANRIIEQPAIEVRHAEVSGLVDSGAEHGAAVLEEVFGIIGASSQEADSQRRLCDDHGLSPDSSKGHPI